MLDIILALTLILSLIGQTFIPGFPKETILIQAGISFGLVGGAIINWFGMVIGAQLAYELVRSSTFLTEKFTTYLQEHGHPKYIEYIQEKGNFGLFFVRLIPYAPNDFLSFICGLLLLPRRGFLFVSLITAIPYAFVFAYFGVFGVAFLGKGLVIYINFTITSVIVLYYIVSYLRRKLSDSD